MAERKIDASEFFKFAKNKRKDLCAVKHCRNPRKSDRRICHKCNMRLWRARNPTRAAYNNLKGKATHRRIRFDLTFKEFSTVVHATGYIDGKGNYADSLHIDRIDNRGGYTLDNIQVITCSENVVKGNKERFVTLENGRVIPVTALRIGMTVAEEDWVDEGLVDDMEFETDEMNPF